MRKGVVEVQCLVVMFNGRAQCQLWWKSRVWGCSCVFMLCCLCVRLDRRMVQGLRVLLVVPAVEWQVGKQVEWGEDVMCILLEGIRAGRLSTSKDKAWGAEWEIVAFKRLECMRGTGRKVAWRA